jgi:hypothetical protein
VGLFISFGQPKNRSFRQISRFRKFGWRYVTLSQSSFAAPAIGFGVLGSRIGLLEREEGGADKTSDRARWRSELVFWIVRIGGGGPDIEDIEDDGPIQRWKVV